MVTFTVFAPAFSVIPTGICLLACFRFLRLNSLLLGPVLPCFLLSGFAQLGVSCRPGDVLCPCLLLTAVVSASARFAVCVCFRFSACYTILALRSHFIDMSCHIGLIRPASLSVASPWDWVCFCLVVFAVFV